MRREGKNFIESNGWLLHGRHWKEMFLCEKALDSVKERMDSTFRIVSNNPAFTKYYIEYGERRNPAGYKEYDGIFCHYNPWIMIAKSYW
jgi:cellobiose phosphorylase